MAELLEKTNSSYYPSFKTIFHDVVEALTEAQDINLYLKPLASHFEDLEQAEFDECIPMLAPLMHCICLAWVHSKHYSTPARIIVLLQELCNLMIQQVTTHTA